MHARVARLPIVVTSSALLYPRHAGNLNISLIERHSSTVCQTRLADCEYFPQHKLEDAQGQRESPTISTWQISQHS